MKNSGKWAMPDFSYMMALDGESRFIDVIKGCVFGTPCPLTTFEDLSLNARESKFTTVEIQPDTPTCFIATHRGAITEAGSALKIALHVHVTSKVFEAKHEQAINKCSLQEHGQIEYADPSFATVTAVEQGHDNVQLPATNKATKATAQVTHRPQTRAHNSTTTNAHSLYYCPTDVNTRRPILLVEHFILPRNLILLVTILLLLLAAIQLKINATYQRAKWLSTHMTSNSNYYRSHRTSQTQPLKDTSALKRASSGNPSKYRPMKKSSSKTKIPIFALLMIFFTTSTNAWSLMCVPALALGAPDTSKGRAQHPTRASTADKRHHPHAHGRPTLPRVELNRFR